MELLLKRHTFTEKSTISDLAIDGKYFCKILEDKDRGLLATMSIEELKSLKIHGKTAIPKGRYQIVLSYSNRFKKYLPELLHVPAYEGIRIHPGNYAEDTEGCLLPGNTQVPDAVLNSVKTFDKLFEIIKSRVDKEKIYITIE